MKKISTALSMMFIFVVLAVHCSTVQASETSCLICHNVMSGKTTLSSGEEIDLGIDTSKYQASVHGFLTCTACHQRFDENPHTKPSEKVSKDIADLAKKIENKAKIDSVAYSACSACHDEVYQQVLSSPHGTNVTEKQDADGALCLDCHGSPHYIVKSDDTDSPVNQWQVVETCGHCHGDKKLTEKYNIETNVLTSYVESFHGKKHHLGHRGAPTCVSCHGSHDIKRKDDPSSPVFAGNKLETCGGCHKGANEKFVAAITHKPVGPIPHYAEISLIILTLGVFAFIVSHVLLEAYSDIRDAIFRKRRRTSEDESGKECA